MTNPFQSFLQLLARSDESQLELENQFLKAEVQILRAKIPGPVRLTARERQRLLRFGKPLGKDINDLITIVAPRTFARWLQEADKPRQRQPRDKSKGGRPPIADKLRDQVLEMARDSSWGSKRIYGELKKLGFGGQISRSTIVNILREHGIETGPERGDSTWPNFVKVQRSTIVACDFFTKKVWTLTGPKLFYVLFFIGLATRRVYFAGCTTNPDRAWMMERAQELRPIFDSLPEKPRFLIRDRDTKFVTEFDALLEDQGIAIKRTAPRQPTQNAVAERFVGTAKRECLDHLLVFGETQLRFILAQMERHVNEERPHQGLDNGLVSGQVPEPSEVASVEHIVCEERLGGLLRHYHHPKKAAA